MASYDNTQYSYEDVLKGNGFYKLDTSYTPAKGVKTLQERLNLAGFWCGTEDGKFGEGTDEAVRHFQREYSLKVDGAAGQETLTKLDSVYVNSPGFPLTSGTYGVRWDSTNKRFLHNQQVVYECLKNAGLSKIAIAGFMGNLHAENEFKTRLSGTGGAIGLAQWATGRKSKLEDYAKAISQDITSIRVQAAFILEECKSGGTYRDSGAETCMTHLKDSTKVKTVRNAADCVTANFERCLSYTSWSAVQSSGYGTSRFSTTVNDCDGKYYLDTPKRRGYADAYYSCISKM